MYCTQYDSPVGRLLLTCQEDALTGIWFDRECSESCTQEDHPILQQTRLWLDAYFWGEDPPAEIPLLLKGTDFQKRVWNLLLTIPYGDVCTYGNLAAAMGAEQMSAQAVGQAVGKNPISILIPCHRVIGAKGQLTGYAGGLDKKIWLLRHEGRQIEKETVR